MSFIKDFIPGKTYIPVSGQEISDEDVAILHEVVDSRWYTDGKWCKKFRDALCELTDKKFCTLVNSGSSASLIASLAEGKYGDYVISCATGFPTTVTPIYQSGKIPIYIDINPDTLEPVYDEIEQAREYYRYSRGGISWSIFAHTLGFPYDESKLVEIIGRSVTSISDCCDALGALLPNGMHVGYESDLMTLSFFPAHHITCGEGGAVLTDDRYLYEEMESLVNWGRSCKCPPGHSNVCGRRFNWEDRGELPQGYDHKYIFDRVGYNLKMTEFQAALGYSQLQRLNQFVSARNNHHTYLVTGLSKLDYDGKIQIIMPKTTIEPSMFGFPIIEKTGKCNELIQWLEDHKIATRRLFGGVLPYQPAFNNLEHRIDSPLTGSKYLMNNAFWIGVQPSLTTEMLDYVIETVKGFYG